MTDNKIEEMLSINVNQKKYYEVASGGETSQINNTSTNLWRKIRKRAFGVFSGTNRKESVDELHRKWIGDISQARVLDLGVGSGNPLSFELAAKAKVYVAIDLSQSRINALQNSLDNAGIKGAKLYASDFLGEDFKEADFDVIYALAVFHHFKHFDVFLNRINSKLAPGGRVVTYDPAQVWWPANLLRLAFRPFQTDAEWEFPFGEQSLTKLEEQFEVLNCQGVLGRSKWAGIVGIFSPAAGAKFAQKWHDSDLRNKTTQGSLRSCLQVSYHLKNRS